jgi:hypothetical protein
MLGTVTDGEDVHRFRPSMLVDRDTIGAVQACASGKFELLIRCASVAATQ